MKSYLGLVSEYAKVHKKKNRLTVICIAISVMLVTTIFGMADMSVNAQINAYLKVEGNFHAVVNGITDDVARKIGSRSDVALSDWVLTAEDTSYQGKLLHVQGSGQAFAAEMRLVVQEGRFPETEHEALLDQKALQQFGISIGDTIEVPFADGTSSFYCITGAYGEFSMLNAKDSHGLFLTVDGVRAIHSEQASGYYYVQFKKGVNIRNALASIKADYGLADGQISENARLLALMGQSDNSSILQLYLTAMILFVLVTMAGVFMIAGSFNMSVLERTQFFGLLRCLGASKRQIKRYIRLEGLQYSMKGIPLGLLAGCLIMWGTVFLLNMLDLRFVLPEMPLFQISWPGIGAGALMGFLVVMLASRAPAKKASQVSPQAAITGNLNQTSNHSIHRAVNAKLPVDTAMGIHHALSNKKNLLLTSGSFALSIILLLSFSVLIVFMQHALNPLKPYAPDISLITVDNKSTIDGSVVEKLRALPHIKQLYGRMFSDVIPSSAKGQDGSVTLVSYDEPQLQWARKMLVDGQIEDVRKGKGVLVEYDKSEQLQWEVGDIIALQLAEKTCELPVVGILSDVPFGSEDNGWVFLCSEALFTEITGIQNYTIVDLQVTQDISEQVRSVIPADMELRDMQQRNQESRTAYYTMAIFVYGFVFVIALVAFMNIINTVNASISGRIGYYGVMRAVGMSGKQVKKVVFAEAVTYAAAGCVAGAVLGLVLHRFFFKIMVTENWGQPWEPPLSALLVMVAACILTTGIAIIAPTRKMQRMSIVSAVNAE